MNMVDMLRQMERMGLVTGPDNGLPLRDRETAVSSFMAQYREHKQFASQRQHMSGITLADPVCAGHVCGTPIQELTLVTDIKKLAIGQINRGKLVWVKTLCPVFRASGVWALVEDEVGNVFEAGLYDIIPNHLSLDMLQTRLPVGTRLGFKDPYFKFFSNGGCGLKVEHKANVEIILPDKASAVSNKPTPGSPVSEIETLQVTAEQVCSKGNFEEADAILSKALQIAATKQVQNSLLANLYMQRAEARVSLKAYKAALEDAEKCLSIADSHPEGLFAKAKALRGLRRYSDASKVFTALTTSTDKSSAIRMLAAGPKRDCDDLHRKYVLGKICPSDSDTITDDFYGPVQVKRAPGKGRGLFTTRPVLAGEILLMERPFAHGEPEELAEKIHARLSASKIDLARFSLLSNGSPNFKSVLPNSMAFFRFDDHTCIDAFPEQKIPTLAQIQDVITTNALGTCDLHLFASFMNHSDTPNTTISRSLNSNVMFVAALDLPAGVELTTTYASERQVRK